MNEEYLFKFARENNWDKILKIALRDHSFENISSELAKTPEAVQIDLFKMESFGLITVEVTDDGGRNYLITDLGLKLINEQIPK